MKIYLCTLWDYAYSPNIKHVICKTLKEVKDTYKHFLLAKKPEEYWLECWGYGNINEIVDDNYDDDDFFDIEEFEIKDDE